VEIVHYTFEQFLLVLRDSWKIFNCHGLIFLSIVNHLNDGPYCKGKTGSEPDPMPEPPVPRWFMSTSVYTTAIGYVGIA
jgi:hypothetical protein